MLQMLNVPCCTVTNEPVPSSPHLRVVDDVEREDDGPGAAVPDDGPLVLAQKDHQEAGDQQHHQRAAQHAWKTAQAIVKILQNSKKKIFIYKFWLLQ